MNTKAKPPKESATSASAAASPAEPAAAAKTSAPVRHATPQAVAKGTGKNVPAVETAKAENKTRKTKMVRDSFTMPEMDYSQLDVLKKKCLRAGIHVKKSELLRAGLLSLAKLPDAALIKAVEAVEKLKTGRPAKA